MQNSQLKLLVAKDSNIPSECRELLQKVENMTFEMEESSEMFKELKETLCSTLERLYLATKKKKKD